MREIVTRILDGDPISQISDDLNERGILSATGKKWWPNTIRTLVSNSRIAGLRRHKDQVVGLATWPAIIDDDTWTRAQDVMEQRNAVFNNGTVRHYYLLRGILRCTCGNKMVGENRPTATKPVARVYRCKKKAPNGDGCGARQINADFVESAVSKAVVAEMSKVDLSVVETGEMDVALATALAEDERQLATLREEWANKELAGAEYDKLKTIILDRMVRTREQATGQSQRYLRTLTGPDFPNQWATYTNQKKNQILRQAVPEIRILPRFLDQAQGYFDLRRLDITWGI